MFRILPAFLLLSAAHAAIGPSQPIGPPTTIGPGQPTFLQVGTLSCAARMYTPTQLQVWCFKDPALRVVLINVLNDVSDGTGLQLNSSDSGNIATCTSVTWTFLPTIPTPSIPPEVPPLTPTVAWQATITRATVVGSMLSGVL
jgi:hypothetical protein